jgi:hypothetical protein
MKTTLFNSILCASLLVFAVGCGKNKSGGKSSSAINYSGLNQSSQQLITNLNSWYNGRTEGSRALGLMNVEKKQTTANNNQNCSSIDLGLFDLPYCTYSYSSNSSSGTTVSNVQLTLVNTDNAVISSRNNTELNSIFNGSAGQILQATSVGTQAVRVDVLSNNVITSYIIDMSYHSMLNPVVKTVGSQSPVTTTTVASCVNTVAPFGYPGGCTIR